MGVELNMKIFPHDQSQSKHEDGLPRKPSLRSFALRGAVGPNKPATAGPFAKLVGGETCQCLNFTGADHSHVITRKVVELSTKWVSCPFDVVKRRSGMVI